MNIVYKIMLKNSMKKASVLLWICFKTCKSIIKA